MNRLEHIGLIAIMVLASVATIATSPRRSAWSTTAPVKAGRRPVVLNAATPEQRLRVRFEVSAAGRMPTTEVPEIRAEFYAGAQWNHEGPTPRADLVSVTFEPDDLPPAQSFVPLSDGERKEPLGDRVSWIVAGKEAVCPRPPGPCILEATAVFAWDGDRTGTVTLRPEVQLTLVGPHYGKEQPLPEGAEIRVLEAEWR